METFFPYKQVVFMHIRVILVSTLLMVGQLFSNQEALVSSINDFGIRFHEEQEPKKNSCLSHYSLFSCLSMAYVGAQEQTALAMQKVLSLRQEDIPSAFHTLKTSLAPFVRIADALWIQEGIALEPAY